MPAIRPVNHLIDDGQVIIRSHEGSAIVTATSTGSGTVVAYEADEIDPASRTGWSVMVTGLARLVDEPGQATRYREALQPACGACSTSPHAARPMPAAASSPGATCSSWDAGTVRPASAVRCSPPGASRHPPRSGPCWKWPGRSHRDTAPSRSSP
jgi:Pyridoxamine 5'-phosphate oxidase